MSNDYGIPDNFDDEDRADAEMLIMAAKAAGLRVQYSSNCGDFSIGEPYSKGEARWNPLDFDRDSMDLVALLEIGLEFFTEDHYDEVSACRYGREPQTEQLEVDRPSAIRRAIVRAAADIGRSMS